MEAAKDSLILRKEVALSFVFLQSPEGKQFHEWHKENMKRKEQRDRDRQAVSMHVWKLWVNCGHILFCYNFLENKWFCIGSYMLENIHEISHLQVTFTFKKYKSNLSKQLDCHKIIIIKFFL